MSLSSKLARTSLLAALAAASITSCASAPDDSAATTFKVDYMALQSALSCDAEGSKGPALASGPPFEPAICAGRFSDAVCRPLRIEEEQVIARCSFTYKFRERTRVYARNLVCPNGMDGLDACDDALLWRPFWGRQPRVN